MRTIKSLNILILILAVIQLNAQEQISSKIIEIEFQTIEKKSNDIIIASVIEIQSNGELIGLVYGDYDGISKLKVCSKKIKDSLINIRVYGMNCKPFQKEYKIITDSKITINLEYGETKYKTLDDRKLILADLNIPISDVEIDELDSDVIYYQHCDGRVKKKKKFHMTNSLNGKRLKTKK